MQMHRAWIPVAVLALTVAGVVAWRSAPQTIEGLTGITYQSAAEVPLRDSLLGDQDLFPLAKFDSSNAASALQVEFDPLLEGETVHADAVDVPVPLPARPAGLRPTPGALPQPDSAQPIDVRTADAERQLELLIERELADLPEHQRDVWRDVLHGLSPKEAEEILQIWKLTGRIDRTPARSAWPPVSAEPTRLPISANPSDFPPTAVEILRHNLEHIATPGFRRREPSSQLDLTPGEIRQTENPFHVAIDGAGFFVLRNGDEVAVTRNGTFDLNEDHQLIQRRIDGDWRLSPVIQLPDDAVQIQIRDDGQVLVRRSGQPDSLQPRGQMQLATFLNPQHLESGAADLLRPTSRSGAPSIGNPRQGGTGGLRQGALEQSNASVATEAAILDRYEQRGQLLQRIPQPPASAAAH